MDRRSFLKLAGAVTAMFAVPAPIAKAAATLNPTEAFTLTFWMKHRNHTKWKHVAMLFDPAKNKYETLVDGELCDDAKLIVHKVHADKLHLRLTDPKADIFGLQREVSLPREDEYVHQARIAYNPANEGSA